MLPILGEAIKAQFDNLISILTPHIYTPMAAFKRSIAKCICSIGEGDASLLGLILRGEIGILGIERGERVLLTENKQPIVVCIDCSMVVHGLG